MADKIDILTEDEDEVWERIARNNYSSTLLQPEAWFKAANEITAAMTQLEPKVLAWWQSIRSWADGNGIFDEHNVSGTYMMLAGYAIENLCKGHFINRLHSSEQIRRLELEQKVAKGELDESAIVKDCWKLTTAERQQVKSDGKFPSRLDKKHNLLEMVSLTGLRVKGTDDEELLARLTWAVRWFGRYPIPLSFKGMDKTKLSDGKTYSTTVLAGNDLERIKTLITTLRSHVGAKESYRLSEGT